MGTKSVSVIQALHGETKLITPPILTNVSHLEHILSFCCIACPYTTHAIDWEMKNKNQVYNILIFSRQIPLHTSLKREYILKAKTQ